MENPDVAVVSWKHWRVSLNRMLLLPVLVVAATASPLLVVALGYLGAWIYGCNSIKGEQDSARRASHTLGPCHFRLLRK